MRSKKIREYLKNETEDILIGISWKSSSNSDDASWRQLPLADLVNSLKLPRIKLVNLQYGDVSDEINSLQKGHDIDIICVNEIDNKNDLDGLAALISALDLVVSIDNVTVHLAGALGIPTKVLLPYACDWRWGTNSNSNYWYDSVELYRQETTGDWTPVLNKLTEHLHLLHT